MSKYVQLEVTARSLDEVMAALAELGLTAEIAPPDDRLMLQGSLECAGEPVDVRLSEGTSGAVEDFGFRVEADGRVTLVCSEVDRRAIEAALVEPLRQTLARLQAHAAAARAGLTVDETVEANGTRRLVLRRP
jgi:hypothetical protein